MITIKDGISFYIIAIFIGHVLNVASISVIAKKIAIVPGNRVVGLWVLMIQVSNLV